MQSAHWMHSSCEPLRMSTPVGTHCHALPAIDAVSPTLPRLPCLMRAARLAAPCPIGNQERVAIDHAALDARPWAHIDADLLAGDATQHIGGGGEDADEDISDHRRVERDELARERGRVGEIEHPGAAGRHRDQQPGHMRGALSPQRLERPRRLVETHALIAVALEEALDRNHQVGPHRLRTGITAPHAPGDRGDQEQAKRRKHQQAGDVVEFLRPNLEEEEKEPPRGKVDQHGLVWQIRTPVPANPRHGVVDRQRDRHDDPLDGAERAVRALGIDLDARRIERAFVAADRGRFAALNAWSRLDKIGNAGAPKRHAGTVLDICNRHRRKNLDYWPPPSEWT